MRLFSKISIVISFSLMLSLSQDVLAAELEAVVDQNPVVVSRNPIEGPFQEKFLEQIEMPEGFKIELVTDQTPGARSMVMGDDGTLFVGTRGKRTDPNRLGDVYAVTGMADDFVADQVMIVASDLFMPNGVAFRDGALYIAEPNRLLRYDGIEANLSEPPKAVTVNDSYPSDRHHGWKYIDFGPDGRIYLPVGAPCNICESSDEYAVITSIKADGSDKRIEAKGIRNTVGFDWHPQTKELWFTDNGRDLWTDDLPPEELNRVSERGQHFGYPYEYGKGHRDNVFEVPDLEFQAAALELPAHTAPLGMTFYSGDMFPEKYRNSILIPHHGSWNRSEPAGYYISFVSVEDNIAQPHEVFAEGWLQGKENWGRPTDLLVLADGSLLVSDDQAGAIYRISYEADEESSSAE